MTDYTDEMLFEDYILEMLYYERIDIREGLNLAKSSNSKVFMICHLIIDANFNILYEMVVKIWQC